MDSRATSTADTEVISSDRLRSIYLRRLVLLIAAVAVGACVGGWLAWDYVPDGSFGSYVRGQAPIFIGAAVAGAMPLWWALRARRRWSAHRADGSRAA